MIYLGFDNYNEIREMIGMKKIESIIKEKQVEKKLNTPDWAKNAPDWAKFECNDLTSVRSIIPPYGSIDVEYVKNAIKRMYGNKIV